MGYETKQRSDAANDRAAPSGSLEPEGPRASAVREMRVQFIGKPSEPRPVVARAVRTFAKTQPLYMVASSLPGLRPNAREAEPYDFRTESLRDTTVICDERDVQSHDVVTIIARPGHALAQRRTQLHNLLSTEAHRGDGTHKRNSARARDQADDWRSWRAEDSVHGSGASQEWLRYTSAIALWAAAILCVLAVNWLAFP